MAKSHLAALALLILIGGCGQDERNEESTLNRGMFGSPATIDPQLNSLSAVDALIFDTGLQLFAESEKRSFVPFGASSWSASLEEKSISIALDQEMMWSDGTPVVAADYVRAIKFIADPENNSPHRNKLSWFKRGDDVISGNLPPSEIGFYAVTENELLIETTVAAETIVGFLSQSCFSARPPKHGLYAGRYQVTEFRPNYGASLISNAKFPYRNSHTPQKVVYKFSESESALYSAARSGQLDYIDVLPQSFDRNSTSEEELRYWLADSPEIFMLVVNHSQFGRLTDPIQIRMLSEAIDRNGLIRNVTLGEPTAARGLIPPLYRGFLSSQNRDNETSRTDSPTDLASAGVPTIRVIFNTSESVSRIMVSVTSMWRDKLNIDTELENSEMRVFLSKLATGQNWDLARVSWREDYPDPLSFLEIFASDSPNNFGNFSNDEFDTLLRKAAAAQKSSERNRLLSRAEIVLLEQGAIIPIYFGVDKHLLNVKRWSLDDAGEKSIYRSADFRLASYD